MSWFWGSGTSGKASEESTDPYANLDPKLRDFARQEKHVLGAQGPAQHEPAVTTTTTSDRQADIAVAALQYKEQKTRIGSAALFNCSDTEADLAECFSRGAWWDKASLCEKEKHAFWHCVEVNKRLLQEVGYGLEGNSQERDEVLRGKADDLYLSEQLSKVGEAA